MDQDPAYKMGAPLVSINLGIEEPKKGDIAITAAHRAKKGEIFSHKRIHKLGGLY